MRANSLVFAIPIILGISLPLGLPPLLTEPAAGQEEPAPPDQTWQRLGLPESPTPESGRGVGIVQIDDDGLHPALHHLGERLKHVIVGQDMSVSLAEPLKDYKGREDAEYTHGVRGRLQMPSAPFRVRDRTYAGLAQGVTYFVIPYLTVRENGPDGRHLRYDPRLDRAIEWVVKNRERWNIRVILLTVGVDYQWRFPGRLDSSRDRPELDSEVVGGQGAAGSSSGCTTTRLCGRPGGDREERPAGPRLVSKEQAVQMNASP
jgi:hypothetical protein